MKTEIFRAKEKKPSFRNIKKISDCQAWMIIGNYTIVAYAESYKNEKIILHFQSREDYQNYIQNPKKTKIAEFYQPTLF